MTEPLKPVTAREELSTALAHLWASRSETILRNLARAKVTFQQRPLHTILTEGTAMTQFKMTQSDMDTLLDAMKPVPMIMLQCGKPTSQQENANNAWKALGIKMGFNHMTVRPAGNDPLCFMAEEKT